MVAGAIESFTPDVVASMEVKISAELGVPSSHVVVTVEPMSVRVTVQVIYPSTATADEGASALATNLGSTSAASAFLSTSTIAIQVEEIESPPAVVPDASAANRSSATPRLVLLAGPVGALVCMALTLLLWRSRRRKARLAASAAASPKVHTHTVDATAAPLTIPSIELEAMSRRHSVAERARTDHDAASSLHSTCGPSLTERSDRTPSNREGPGRSIAASPSASHSVDSTPASTFRSFLRSPLGTDRSATDAADARSIPSLPSPRAAAFKVALARLSGRPDASEPTVGSESSTSSTFSGVEAGAEDARAPAYGPPFVPARHEPLRPAAAAKGTRTSPALPRLGIEHVTTSPLGSPKSDPRRLRPGARTPNRTPSGTASPQANCRI